MQPLIDADILLYEIGSIGQYIDEESGEIVTRDFDFVAYHLDQKVKEICGMVWATEPPILFLTNNWRIHKKENRQRKREGKEEKEFVPNFREKVAKAKKYKGTRLPEKPFHYDNLIAYMRGNYDVRIAEGYEADDLICIEQYSRLDKLDTIICTRDKDLRICPGMHFGWECGKQRQFGPKRVSEVGEIHLVGNKTKSIKGEGLKFFYSQMITGDSVDNIPGLPKGGPVMADKLLADCETEEQMFLRVSAAYKNKLGDEWRPYFQEQANLLWMCREFEEDGTTPKRYVMFDERG
jgi:hypothetical protein